MNNTNMINPANYYNPFAKYNYISKTRGVYIPRDTEPLLQASTGNAVKSTSIYSENYDAEADVNNLINENNNDLFSILNNFFSRNRKNA